MIDKPYSTVKPVAPNRLIIFLAGLIGGLGFPFGIIVLMDLFKSSISTEDELRRIIPNRPVIGSFSIDKQNNQNIVVLRDSRTSIAERFRNLKTNLQFNSGNDSQTILVTSSTSTEGKSFIAVNLAKSFELAHKKTIILDFDLRRPSLGDYFGNTSENGLSNYLAGHAAVKDIIRKVSDSSNLDYISSGPVPPDPSELMDKKPMAELFTFLQKEYDVIIVDSPPVGIVSDAILLNKYITKSIYVVKLGFTKKIMVSKAKEIWTRKTNQSSNSFQWVKEPQNYGHNYYAYHSN